MQGQKALRFHQTYLKLCSKDEQRSYGFGTAWGWVINDRIFIFGWANPLRQWQTKAMISCHPLSDCCWVSVGLLFVVCFEPSWWLFGWSSMLNHIGATGERDKPLVQIPTFALFALDHLTYDVFPVFGPSVQVRMKTTSVYITFHYLMGHTNFAKMQVFT